MNANMRRPKVLVSAYACEPGRGSEPGVGWNWVQQLGRQLDVWCLTRANNRRAIEQTLTRMPLPSVRFVYFDLPSSVRFWKRGQRGVHFYYYLWQLGVFAVARRLHEAIRFDATHHVTLGTYWMPSLLAALPTPFIWGPVGGAESAPVAFYGEFGVRGRAYESVRDLGRRVARLDPLVRLTAKRAVLTLSKTRITAQAVRALGAKRVIEYPEAGLSESEIAKLSVQADRQELRFISVGRLDHWKGFSLALKAFARLNQLTSGQAEYFVVGDGYARNQLQQLAVRLGINGVVKFTGALPRDDVFDLLRASHVCVHPSLHDSGGWVCLEAMAAGLPVIAFDLGGAGVQVTSDTGIKLLAHSPASAIEEMTGAMVQLARDPDLRVRLGAAGRNRVREVFDWDAKGQDILRFYRHVIPGLARLQ